MLTCESLTVAYDTTPILRNVDITVEDGEIVGIMGKNGAGKTTLMKALIGLLNPRDGTIKYEGTDLAGTAPNERARLGMGYIPQGRDVFPDLTVEQNLLVGESINAADTDPSYDLVYEYFPILEERNGQKAGTLSGGQQQMLAIARALVGNPDLLLLDEPSEGIQPSIVDQISEKMRTINDENGTTILFVEQNLGVIRGMADRCYAMKRGEVVDELTGSALENERRIADHLAV
ncbi:ABC transporter ATP-binding protein [Halococcus sp. PRR34]|uniref:ABC transporter ATP-binding protein n=1 Tax=Halococcus sp. PRR34 TaxID=3020830 RepID=UPI00235FAD5F|nr:ABC transporter ATP-binding protein [Halococcus sp. PRR34]